MLNNTTLSKYFFYLLRRIYRYRYYCAISLETYSDKGGPCFSKISLNNIVRYGTVTINRQKYDVAEIYKVKCCA